MKMFVLAALLLAGTGAGPALAELPARHGHDLRAQNVRAAETPEGTQRVLQLITTMQLDGILNVMREEGIKYGKTLETDMFSGKGGTTWTAAVERIYDAAAMKSQVETALVAELGVADTGTLDVMEAFFGSDRGQRILTLEIEARRALLDQDAEDAAKARFEELLVAGDPRLDVIREFADANDLIEMNVSGALNANLAFFKGMAANGGFDEEMTEDQMLQNVWSQEPAIRDETESWLFPYLALAYMPLSDDDMAAYLAFSELAEGKALNTAMFVAFDILFTGISGNLGRAAAKQMRGEDI